MTAPAFVAVLEGASDTKRIDALETVHPEYAARSDAWQVLLDAYEGAGGFLDGTYLWPYGAETDNNYTKRKQMARYHNYVSALVDLYVRYVFTQGVKRTTTSQEYGDWTRDVDGAGTSLDTLLKRAVAMALANSHAGILIDRTPDAPAGPSKADERARTIAVLYAATSILDWRMSPEGLKGVKLRESVKTPGIVEAMPDGAEAFQFLLWDTEGWARYDRKGELLNADTPNLDMVPLVTVRPLPSITSNFLGRSLVGNANVVKALFNRASEEDEVLRRQSFSLLTVEVDPATGDVEGAKTALGSSIGTATAIVVPGKIDYKTPDQTVTEGIRASMSNLVQELYRSAHVRFRRDSLGAETAEAIRLQWSELNEMLQGVARNLETVEKQIARAWFAWASPSPDAAKAAYEKAEVEAVYPTEFFLDDLMTDLEAWGEAIRLDLGETMTKRIKKRAVRRLEPEMPLDDLQKIDAEIDAQEDVMLPEKVAVPPEVPPQDGEEPVA